MNKLKVLGLLTTAGGFVLTLVSNWIQEKQQDEIIEEKVNKALAEKGK